MNDEAALPGRPEGIFSGNVKVQSTVYPPGTTVLDVLGKAPWRRRFTRFVKTLFGGSFCWETR